MKHTKGVVTVLLILICIMEASLSLPRLWGHEAVIVSSGSMEPAVMTGSVAFIDHHDTAMQEGKIVAFRLSDTVPIDVLHRIQEIKADGSAVTRGDANENADALLLSEDRVIGSYLFSIPYLGYIADALNGPLRYVMVGLVVIMTAFVILPEEAVEEAEDE